MDFIINLLPFLGSVLLAIMILVFVHEMGHFLTAKLFKMRVDRFSVGFPPNLMKKKIGETEYVLGATPLGGYVKIDGMVDESLDTDGLASEPQPWEFRAKPVWQRIVVITAGVIFNMILAWIIFTALKAAYGDTFVPAENVQGVYVADSSLAHEIGLRTGDRIVSVGGERLERMDDLERDFLMTDSLSVTVVRDGQEQAFTIPPDMITRLNRTRGALGVSSIPSIAGAVSAEMPAAAAGLQKGDRIVQVGAQPVTYWQQLTDAVTATQGQPTTLRFYRADSLTTTAPDTLVLTEVDRDALGRYYETTLTPKPVEGRYMIGVEVPTVPQINAHLGVQHHDLGLGQAMKAGVTETWEMTTMIVKSLTRVFTGRDNLRENLGGPVQVAAATGNALKAGWDAFWRIVAMLSITLAIMNILPIPALDGGHLVFLIYEGIVRREPSLKFRMVAQQIGMAMLLLFMVFLFFNDALRLLGS